MTLYSKILLCVFILSPNLIIHQTFASDTNIETETYGINCGNSHYYIAYNASNAIVTNVTVGDNEYLILSIQNSTKGTLIVDIPQNYMLSEIPYESPIVVLDNGEEPKFKDTSNSTHWILDIPLLDGNSKLELARTGTPEGLQLSHKSCSLVPEFGMVTSFVLVVGIISVVFISARTKMKIK